MKINPDKNIGKVLIIVEGLKTEFYLLRKLFTQIFDYTYEKLDRLDKYQKYNEKEGIESSIFVINTENSAISYINNSNEYMNALFERLIEKYKFPVDRAAIYYLFDRDIKSNTDAHFISDLIGALSSSRDVNEMSMMQGLLLLSYPCIESYTAANFIDRTIDLHFDTGENLKQFLHQNHVNQSKITRSSVLKAVEEMELGLREIGVSEYDIDDFSPTNRQVFEHQEEFYSSNSKLKCLSLLSVILLDLGIIELDSDE
ncbi:hypothetical protein B5M42_013045 [Paenibacillus athensensis]|uniref:Uncharacterized protein n=1 Tax=Paenibacillus athensensis TaxID=1967502 RepID=A0A4Y8Q718_9BACL|nr:hypothetical protein [Paenibacillus athensensis]MCD1259761.1 hypothetical protein [Paenibacillus athensensis]